VTKYRQGQELPKMYIWCTSPGDGQTSCKVRLASGEQRCCSKEAKTRNPLKFAGVPQTRQRISAASGLKFAILWGHVDKILLFNKFLPVSIHVLVAKIHPDKLVRWCRDGDFWRLLRPVFSASRVQYISHLHSKFALRPLHVSMYGRHAICGSSD